MPADGGTVKPVITEDLGMGRLKKISRGSVRPAVRGLCRSLFHGTFPGFPLPVPAVLAIFAGRRNSAFGSGSVIPVARKGLASVHRIGRGIA